VAFARPGAHVGRSWGSVPVTDDTLSPAGCSGGVGAHWRRADDEWGENGRRRNSGPRAPRSSSRPHLPPAAPRPTHRYVGPGSAAKGHGGYTAPPSCRRRASRGSAPAGACAGDGGVDQAVAPVSAAKSLRDSGPREFATRTSCPDARSLRTSKPPMFPVPMIPIFIAL